MPVEREVFRTDAHWRREKSILAATPTRRALDRRCLSRSRVLAQGIHPGMAAYSQTYPRIDMIICLLPTRRHQKTSKEDETASKEWEWLLLLITYVRQTHLAVITCHRRGAPAAAQLALSPVHTSNNVQATLSNATSWTIFSTMSTVASTLLRFLATPVAGNFVLSTKSKQIEQVQFVSTLSRGRTFVRHCCRNRQQCCQKRQQCQSNIRLCRKDEILQ